MRTTGIRSFLSIGLGLILVACAQGAGAPTSPPPSPVATSPDPLVDVRAALVASGVTVVDPHETTSTDPTFACLSKSMRTFAFDQEAPHATFQPGEKPPINALAFPSTVERQAAQSRIGSDGSQINGPGCGASIDWVATPHWVGGGRYLLLVVSNDANLAAEVAAAAARLGPP